MFVLKGSYKNAFIAKNIYIDNLHFNSFFIQIWKNSIYIGNFSGK